MTPPDLDAPDPPVHPPARRHLEDLGARRRFLGALAAWLLIALAQPGIGRPHGFGHFAFVALAPWAFLCCRPGPRAFLVEWGAAAIGLMLTFAWMGHLLPWLVPPMGIVPGVWVALGGVLLRRLARHHPLALAAPAAWMAAELLRWTLPVPLSFGWWRLGTFAHDEVWLSGSARVWGTFGLTWVFAAFGGWLADLWRLRGLAPDGAPPFSTPWVHVCGLTPLALAIGLTAAVPPPETTDGPRLLIVQPGIESELKAEARDPFEELFARPVRQTVEAIAAGAREGEPPPDLVCWGETMFPLPLISDAVVQAHRDGLRRMSFVPPAGDRDLARARADLERLVERELLGPSGVLPPTTAFLTGIVEWIVHGDSIRSLNAVALWGSGGRFLGTAAKRHLVPVAESIDGYARLPWVVDAVRSVGWFVPDFVPAERTGVLELPAPDGDAWRFGVAVCYDNAFDDPFREPLRRGGGADFHLVVSNEGWYRDGIELDYMVAFSRLHAIASGRTVVRATNSGVSIAIDPTGATLAELVAADGRRKGVAGTLSVVVPVPVPEARTARTPWARTGHWQGWVWASIVVLVAVRGYRRRTGG